MTDKIDDLEELAVKVERIFGDFWAVGKMIQEYQLNSGDKTGSSRAFYSKLSKLLVERMGNYTRPYINPKYLKGYVLLVELFPDKEEYLKAANGIGISPQVMMSDFSKEVFSWYPKEIKSMIMEGHQDIPVIMRETDYMRYKKEEKLDLYFSVLCSYIRACLPKKKSSNYIGGTGFTAVFI